MSRIRADQLVNRAGSGGPKFPNGVAEGFSVSGVVTATSFRGDGSQLSGVDASTLKDGNDIKVQATATGATVTGTLTATAFSGDGSNITNAGSSLSAGSGTQRVVLTGQTSGTMTQSATDSVLTYNSDTDTLNVQNLNVQGTTTTIDTAITEVDSLEVEGSVGIGTTNTTTVYGTNAKLHIDTTNITGQGPIHIHGNKNTHNGSILSIRAAGVAHTDANVFAGIKFGSAPGADWIAGKATRNGSGLFELRRETDNTYLQIDQNGHIYPGSDNAQDLGSSSKRFANLYTGDLNLSNEGSTNDVDGTWGSYVIQEGEDDLFLINRRTGKKYKFNLTEV